MPAYHLNGLISLARNPRFSFHSRGAITSLTTPQPWVAQIPEGIAEHVEGVDGNRQAEPGPERQPGRLLHEPAPIPAEHAAPVRNGGWRP